MKIVLHQRLHVKCRKEFTEPNRIVSATTKQALEEQPSISLRPKTPVFNFNEHCFFCGKAAKFEDGKKRGHDVFPVRTDPDGLMSSVAKLCQERNDTWGKEVKGRLAFASCLHAADAVYHQSCSVNFRTFKDVPKQHASSSAPKRTSGRPVNEETENAFQKAIAYFEDNDEEQLTVGHLVDKMQKCLDEGSGLQAFSTRHMKEKLKKHFGDQIIITQLNGKPDVVTFRSNAATILFDFYKEQKQKDCQSDSMRIIQAAGKLIRSEIKSMEECAIGDTYPSNEQLADSAKALNYLPPMLNELLQILFTGKNTGLKRASVGQVIKQGTRPRAILAPLQFGLAEQMHHKFASRFLVDTLHRHGFSCSYAEVHRFESSAALQGVQLPEYIPGQFVQFVADNVDHNIRTLDGHNTFHGMGIIATYTPAATLVQKAIPRVSVTSDEIKRIGRINIKNFKSQHTGALPLTFKELTAMEKVDSTADFDLLWDISLVLQSRRPSWSGLMQTIQTGLYPGKSSVLFLAMIDLDPGNPTCIFSTLSYVCEQAKTYNIPPVLTFDQPLFWKALLIIEAEPSWSYLKNVVLRLGGLRMEMSFMGCIGHLMAGSGLEQVLETVYAENAVKHILSGKVIARAVRGHLLTHAALSTVLVANAYNIPLPTLDEDDNQVETSEVDESEVNSEETSQDENNLDSESSTKHSLSMARDLFAKAQNNELTELSLGDVMQSIQEKIQTEKDSLADKRTSKLSLQYMEMVGILRRFIKAERTGNWELHLQTVQEMLAYFAAAGHICMPSQRIYICR